VILSIALADNDDFTFLANDGNDLVKTGDNLSSCSSAPNPRNNHFTIDGGAGDDKSLHLRSPPRRHTIS